MIRVRGARQNNLQGLDVDLPLGQLIVVTGPSGSGKSSFAFDTLYAEGQRRYVETFSPYTRQFLDRMDKPQADLIEGIPPAIAIEQANSVKTTRSTVGTITEINDYLKLFFPRAAHAFCPECQREIRTETPTSILEQIYSTMAGQQVLVTFGIPVPPGTKPADFFDFLRQQGYLRVWLYGKVVRTDEAPGMPRLPAVVPVIQDRIAVTEENRSRLSEAIEASLRLGAGKIDVHPVEGGNTLPYSSGWHCAHCDITIRPPSPGLFTFNNPLGACPDCRGFGRVIGIDWTRVMPDKSLSIAAGVVRPFQSGQSKECQRDLMRAAAKRDVDVHIAFDELPEADQKWVLEGDGGNPEESWQHGGWYGVQGFFNWLESKTYKMHIRVLLSRYRSYQPCPTCKGGRFQPETLNYRLEPAHRTLPEIASTPVRDLRKIMAEVNLPTGDPSSLLLRDQIASRLNYLDSVGLGYLTLDRPTRTLSGGEIERVNLTTCLGASLVNTLFVMDEPSVGLHPRDTSRLVEIMHALRDKGNTLVVVEHEEAIIRAADHLVDIGPGRGSTGGKLMYSGPLTKLQGQESLTGDYLSGKKTIPIPAKRRKSVKSLRMKGIRHHNLQGLDVDIPLGVFCAITGVSGSGKSSLIHDVLYRNLVAETPDETDGPGYVRSLKGDEDLGDIVMVDQSPLARSPRSTPAVYLGVYDGVRELFGTLPESLGAGLSPSSFSFNSGNGRCERCAGLGFEKVEMQFLSDLFLRCPECEGKRFQPHVLKVEYKGKSIHDVLEMTVRDAIGFFAGHARIVQPLQLLADVGLDYLRLGQPVNALSGGESQRLKLASHLAERRETGALLIFDEPTTGLHFDDVAQLLRVFQRLVDEGDSVIVIEHNLEVIKSADWVVDLGPEAGDQGGKLVAAGTPEDVAKCADSHTGRFLAQLLNSKKGQKVPVARATTPKKALDVIRVQGAREHNLKNITVEIPREKIVVVTGLSGSGKSTLAFDILFAEGQRRFLDSMSAYARQFVEQMEKPDVDSIEGLPPSVAIEQRVTRGGGKSTVATVTEIYHFLRLLFAKLGTQHCPDCHVPVEKQTLSAIVTTVQGFAKKGKTLVFAPLIKARKGFHSKIALWAERQGIDTLLVDGKLVRVTNFNKLERFKEHTIDALVGELDSSNASEIPAIVRRAIELGKGSARVRDSKGEYHILSSEMNCPSCARAFEPLDPRLFSFNSPHGWCTHCRGFGVVWESFSKKEFDSELEAELAEERSHENLEETEARPCPICQGTRLNEVARAVHLQGHTIEGITGSSATDALELVGKFKFRGSAEQISHDILAEISQRLKFLSQVGLDYLTLDRAANTLSGGESQRIRLAAQLGSNLRGVLYVLDEPTIGLHARDNSRLLDALEALAGNGNSLVIVEHDEETMRRADHIIDLGPRAGSRGGEIVAAGPLKTILADKKSLTGQTLREPMRHPSRGERRALDVAPGWVELRGGNLHNLKDVSVKFPLNRLSVVSGISGSGKSTLVRGIVLPAVKDALSRSSRRKLPLDQPWGSITGCNELGAVLEVDQSPIGKSSRSTPATYIKVFDEIRSLYANLPASRMRGYSASRFSFNTEGGRCEACQGQGVIKLEMNFLPAAYMPCQECLGKRYNSATLEIEYNGKSIGDVMEMTVEQAAEFFGSHPKIRRALSLLNETGLGYLKLGQPSPTLSGGEAQRIKLVTQLTRRATSTAEEIKTTRRGKSTLYILEEPTIGLHAHDVSQLIQVLHRLVDEGGTVIVIEHHLDVIAEADYVVDVGPEAGAKGGKVIASGTPEEVSFSKESRTAPFIKEALVQGGDKPAPVKKTKKKAVAI
ncbi:excinuclease ABC subunit A [Terrimicrobium sacchariphilum]|uniref:UvrABC system protein A n=1 Tax=Terrimicrobium sacchariphilum TaxID=690879 RepID=A0A146GDZ2_TERSA|nr:excinuclease ABC subunit UvrA [Terrimicrobium sacchariphilum]GAT35551.1 excinuclease ABC subunit A [Terrimicrobium sacchariphilum]